MAKWEKGPTLIRLIFANAGAIISALRLQSLEYNVVGVNTKMSLYAFSLALVLNACSSGSQENTLMPSAPRPSIARPAMVSCNCQGLGVLNSDSDPEGDSFSADTLIGTPLSQGGFDTGFLLR